MKLVKLIPISQRAKDLVELHGDTYEILVDKLESVMLRSLNETHTYREGVVGKWVGTFTKEEASYEEVNDSNVIDS